MAFSNDGSLLFSVDAAHNVRVWDTSTGACRRVMSLTEAMRTQGATLARSHSIDLPLGILPDAPGQRVCIATTRRAGILSLDSRNPLRLRGHESYVYFAAFSPDGSLLATMAWGGEVRLWDTSSGELVGRRQAHDRMVVCIAFSRDGQSLLAWSRDRDTPTLGIFAIDTLSPVDQEHGEAATRTFFEQAAPGAMLTTAHLGAQAGQSDATGRVVAAAKEAAKWFAMDHGTINAADVVVFSSDPTEPLLSLRLDGVRRSRRSAPLITCAISRDGSLIAAAPEAGSPIHLYNGRTGKPLGTLPGHPTQIFSMDFSRDNTRLATCGNDNLTRIWDVGRREQVLELRGHKRYVHAVRFTPMARNSSPPPATVRRCSGTRDCRPTARL